MGPRGTRTVKAFFRKNLYYNDKGSRIFDKEFGTAFFLPLPARNEWGEDRGEGLSEKRTSSPRPSPPSDGGENPPDFMRALRPVTC